MRFLTFFAAAGLFFARPVAAQTAPALELSYLAQQIEASCPELVRFDAATGLRSLRPALLAPTMRQISLLLAAETAPNAPGHHQSAYEAADTEAPARAEALRVLLTQLQRAQQLSRPAK